MTVYTCEDFRVKFLQGSDGSAQDPNLSGAHPGEVDIVDDSANGALNTGGGYYNGVVFRLRADASTNIAYETFNGVNADLDAATIDNVWSELVGDMDIVSNKLQIQNTGWNRARCETTLGLANQQANVEVDVSGGFVGKVGLALRYDNINDTCYVVSVDFSPAAKTVSFYKIITGTVTLLHGPVNITLPSYNALTRFSARVVDTRISLLVDDKEIAFKIDSSILAGQFCGITGEQVAGTKPLITNWYAHHYPIRCQRNIETSTPSIGTQLNGGDYLFNVRYRTEPYEWSSRGQTQFGVPIIRKDLFPRRAYSRSRYVLDNFTDVSGTALTAHSADIDKGGAWSCTHSLGTIQSNDLAVDGLVGSFPLWFALRSHADECSWHNDQIISFEQGNLYANGGFVRQGIVSRYYNAHHQVVGCIKPIDEASYTGKLEIIRISSASLDNPVFTVVAEVSVTLGTTSANDYLRMHDVNGIIYLQHLNSETTLWTTICWDGHKDMQDAYLVDGPMAMREDPPAQGLFVWTGRMDQAVNDLKFVHYDHDGDHAFPHKLEEPNNYGHHVPIFASGPFTVGDFGLDIYGPLKTDLATRYLFLDAVIYEELETPYFYFYSIESTLPAFRQFALWADSEATVQAILAPFTQDAYSGNLAELTSKLSAMFSTANVLPPHGSGTSIPNQLLAAMQQSVIAFDTTSRASIEQTLPRIEAVLDIVHDHVAEVISELPSFTQFVETGRERTAQIASYLAAVLSSSDVKPVAGLTGQMLLSSLQASATSSSDSESLISQTLKAMITQAVVGNLVKSSVASILRPLVSELTARLEVSAEASSQLSRFEQLSASTQQIQAIAESALIALETNAASNVEVVAQIASALRALSSVLESSIGYASAQADSTLGAVTQDAEMVHARLATVISKLRAVQSILAVTGREFKIMLELPAMQANALVEALTDTTISSRLQTMYSDAHSTQVVTANINIGLGYLKALATVQVVDDSLIESVLSAMRNAGQIEPQDFPVYRLLLKVYAAGSINLETHASPSLQLKVKRDDLR